MACAILLKASLAVFAFAARVDEAADADVIADLEAGDLGANGFHDTGNFVTRHDRVDGILPFVADGVDVRVADAGIFDVDDDVVIVFGVGLNLALGACRLPTPQSTSLQLHVSGLPSFGEMRDAVAERQVEGFRERLVKFIADPKGQAESLREEVKAVCWARGRQVEAHFTDGTTLTGEAIGLNEDASLILRTQDGTDHTVRTADVGVL